MLTGAHHARELSSISMGLYLMLELLYNAHWNQTQAWTILNSTVLYFVPVVNVDGVRYISDWYKNNRDLPWIRKNRNDGSKDGAVACREGPADQLGVDLNRNYDYKWGVNDIGSSSQPCGEDYRGVSPFSEPETQAMRDFIEARSGQIVMAFNFHAFGNLLIYPFNYDTSPTNNDLFNQYPEQALIYEEISLESGLPEGNVRGNAMQAIRYQANGEASDWMLGKHGIVALSPELGIKNSETDTFFIDSPRLLKEVIVENSRWITKAIAMVQSQLKMTIDHGVSYKKKH